MAFVSFHCDTDQPTISPPTHRAMIMESSFLGLSGTGLGDSLNDWSPPKSETKRKRNTNGTK